MVRRGPYSELSLTNIRSHHWLADNACSLDELLVEARQSMTGIDGVNGDEVVAVDRAADVPQLRAIASTGSPARMRQVMWPRLAAYGVALRGDQKR